MNEWVISSRFNHILVKHLAAPVWHLQPFPLFEQSGTLSLVRPGDSPAPSILKGLGGPTEQLPGPRHNPSHECVVPLSHPSPLQPMVWSPGC